MCNISALFVFAASCQVTGRRRRLKKRLAISVLSVDTEPPSQQRASQLGLNGPRSTTASDLIARSRAFSFSDEIISRFRRLMAPGETRLNIAFDEVIDHETNLWRISNCCWC